MYPLTSNYRDKFIATFFQYAQASGVTRSPKEEDKAVSIFEMFCRDSYSFEVIEDAMRNMATNGVEKWTYYTIRMNCGSRDNYAMVERNDGWTFFLDKRQFADEKLCLAWLSAVKKPIEYIEMNEHYYSKYTLAHNAARKRLELHGKSFCKDIAKIAQYNNDRYENAVKYMNGRVVIDMVNNFTPEYPQEEVPQLVSMTEVETEYLDREF